MSNSLKEQYASTPLFAANATAVETLYEKYLEDPESVPGAWREYFQTLGETDSEIAHSAIREELLDEARSGARRRTRVRSKGGRAAAPGQKQAAVSRLIQVYSLRGHQIADIDPLGLLERPMPGVLKLDYLGLTEADMDSEFFTGGLAGSGDERMKLRDIIAMLRKIYCGKIGAEFAHISRARERLWLRKRFERGATGDNLSDEERLWLLEQLTSAEGIERYLHTRYVGQKRFSLEGGESLIPMLDDLIPDLRRRGIELDFAELELQVYSIERIASLARRAAERLRDLGYLNVHVKHFDGTWGWGEWSPYRGILVAAAAPGAPPEAEVEAVPKQLLGIYNLETPEGRIEGVATVTHLLTDLRCRVLQTRHLLLRDIRPSPDRGRLSGFLQDGQRIVYAVHHRGQPKVPLGHHGLSPKGIKDAVPTGARIALVY